MVPNIKPLTRRDTMTTSQKMCVQGKDMFNKNDPTKGAKPEVGDNHSSRVQHYQYQQMGSLQLLWLQGASQCPSGNSKELFRSNDAENMFKQLHKQIFIHLTL